MVDELELLLTPGMRLGVVGPIGSGKSTLLRMIVGEYFGEVLKFWDGSDYQIEQIVESRAQLAELTG